MCLTHVYQCPECGHCNPVPKVRTSVAKHLCEWIRMGQVTIGEDYRKPLVDKICDNRFCMRRADGGYSVCLEMTDPCYFCIRYGQPHLCSNHYLPLICRQCHKKQAHADPAAKSSPKYPSSPPHFRTQRPMEMDDHEAVAAAARDNKLHKEALIQLSVASRMANAAVLAATHK